MRSVYNQRRRKKLRKIRDAERRRERHTGGDFKYRGTWRPRPNATCSSLDEPPLDRERD